MLIQLLLSEKTMIDYDDMIWSIRNISFDKIRAIAIDFVSELTEEEKNELWVKLRRGLQLLRKDEELMFYLYAYGKMHKQKMDIALSHFSWEDFENKQIQIVDWGCGQALATICFFDYLKRKDINCEIERIVLIEPSPEALAKATTHVYPYKYVSDGTEVISINKYINQVNQFDIKSEAEVTIHFFANILDVPNINLNRLSRIVQNCSDDINYVVCVGPSNNFNKKIDDFFSFFNESNLIYEYEHGNTDKYDYTAKYCIFAFNKKKNFDFDDAITVNEFFKRHHVVKKLFVIKTITNDDGESFKVVGFANGKHDKDGRVSYTYFALSRRIELDSRNSVKDYLKSHKKDILLLEPIEGCKYGILFISAIEDWDDL